MAKIIGVDTGIKGKVGNRIYSTWKGVQVMKTMFVPSNPQSPAQTTNRSNFSKLVQLGKPLTRWFLPRTWNDLATSKTSGWADWLGKNLRLQAGAAFSFANLMFTQGIMHNPGIQNATITTPGTVLIGFDGALDGDALANDVAWGFVYNKELGLLCTSDGTAQRTDNSTTISIPSTWNATDLVAYLGFSRDNQNEQCISMSNTVYTDTVTSS